MYGPERLAATTLPSLCDPVSRRQSSFYHFESRLNSHHVTFGSVVHSAAARNFSDACASGDAGSECVTTDVNGTARGTGSWWGLSSYADALARWADAVGRVIVLPQVALISAEAGSVVRELVAQMPMRHRAAGAARRRRCPAAQKRPRAPAARRGRAHLRRAAARDLLPPADPAHVRPRALARGDRPPRREHAGTARNEGALASAANWLETSVPMRAVAEPGCAVSIMMLTCNRREVLVLALQQIAAQRTDLRVEVIVVDDGPDAVEGVARAAPPRRAAPRRRRAVARALPAPPRRPLRPFELARVDRPQARPRVARGARRRDRALGRRRPVPPRPPRAAGGADPPRRGGYDGDGVVAPHAIPGDGILPAAAGRPPLPRQPRVPALHLEGHPRLCQRESGRGPPLCRPRSRPLRATRRAHHRHGVRAPLHNTWGAFENLLKMWRPAEQAPDFVSPTLLAQLRAAHEATAAGRRAPSSSSTRSKAWTRPRPSRSCGARSRRLLEARASSEREEIFAII